MNAKTAPILAGLGALVLAGCSPVRWDQAQPPPVPPLSAEQNRTAYNNEQVALFVSRDPGWQAWLNAVQRSDQVNAALVEASRYNTPVMEIVAVITEAQDAYRVATSYHLTPFTVTSSCLNLYSETHGSVRLLDGLTVRYGSLLSETRHFANGSSCVISIGFINEMDSSGGLPVATVSPGQTIDWQQSFSRYLVWSQPFWRISTGTTLSLSDLVRLIEK